MRSMAMQKNGKLNRLERLLPEGLLADAAWMTQQGYSSGLRSQYVASGWLVQPAHGVFRRPQGDIGWQQAVISLQMHGDPGTAPVLGGKTALALQGYAHYLPQAEKEIHLYGNKRLPGWLSRLPLKETFVFHKDESLFGKTTAQDESFVSQTWGQWNWPLVMASPERALLQVLDELPNRESFDQVDKLFEGLANLSPRRMQALLAACRSVKVKRLFFFFAERHKHSWLKHLDKRAVNLGSGKRVLVKNGRLDPTYQITLPQELFDGLR